jgi:hypothetical protein
MKWADYCVSKLNLNNNGMIESILCCEDEGDSLNPNFNEKNRNWMVQNVSNGKSFCSIKRNDKGSWNKIGDFSYDGNIFKWYLVPKNITKRKTFISYYHFEDQEYKEKFKHLFDDLIIHKSVEDGDINSDNSDDYIKQLIQKDFLVDTTVLVVLIGLNTKHRKHIDWEISGALNIKVGEKCAGILGLILPSHPDFGRGKHKYSNLPGRLADNSKSGFALIRDWTDDRIKLQEYLEEVFNRRTTHYENRDNSRIQMTENTNK